jgi:hypothetical protein
MKRAFLLLESSVDHACRWCNVNKINFSISIGMKGELITITKASDKSFEGFMKNIGALEMNK